MRSSAHTRSAFAVLAGSIFVFFLLLIPGGTASAVHIQTLTITPSGPVPYGQSATITWGCGGGADYGNLSRNSPDYVVVGGGWGTYVTPVFTVNQLYYIRCVDEGYFSNDEINVPFWLEVDYTCPAGTSGSQPNCACNNGLSYSSYPSCTCPSGQVQSGSTCIVPAPTGLYYSCNTSGTQVTVGWSPVAGATAYGPRIGPTAGYSNSYTCDSNGWAYSGSACYYDTWGTTSFTWPVFADTPFNAWVHAFNGKWSDSTGVTFTCPSPVSTVVSISTSGSPGEPSTTGTYTISRTGSTASALSVNATIGGTATRCTAADISTCATTTDYLLSNCSISGTGSTVTLSIPSGQASCSVTLTPKDNTTVESDETATLTLTSSANYSLGTTVLGSFTITDNDAVSASVTIAASPTSVTEGSASTITISRTGSTASSQAITYSRSGGTYTSDYSLSAGTCTSVSSSGATIPSGQSSCTISMSTVSDGVTETGGETVTITLTGASGATIGTPGYTSVTINDAGSGYTCATASNGGATGSYPSCTCNNTGSYTPSNNTCGNPSCSTASPGGASGTYPSCTCSNGGTYSPTNNTCSTGSFNFAVSVVDPTITKGSSGPLIVNAQRSAGSATLIMQYALSWTAGSAPAGVTEGGFSPQYCTPGTSMAECNRETLTVSGSATPGTYTGTVYYTDGTLSKTDVFSLTIQAPASFGFTLQPSSYTISATPGETISNTIYAYATAGTGSVYGFSQSGLPQGSGASFGGGCTATVSGCPTSMQITVPSNASPGTYYVSVYANGDGGTTGSTMFQIEVTNPQEGGGGDLLVSTQVIEDTGEPGTGRSSGYFTLTRTGGEYGVMLPQFMYFDITGTAQLGVDYEFGGESTCQSVSTTGAIIPQGSASCIIEIVPLDDTPPQEEPPETITITITPFQTTYNPD